MKRGDRKQFTYRKADGSVSEREVIVVGTPSDSYFTIDLTEFSVEERDKYAREMQFILSEMDEQFKSMVKEAGLSSCYRRFKAEGVKE